MKQEALKLADDVEALGKLSLLGAYPISEMIRKLVAELERVGQGDYMEGWEEGYQACKNDKQCEPVVYWDGKHFASKEKSSLADIPLYTTPQTKPFNEEEFNAIAYSYRSWPAHDPKGVSDRYQELLNYLERHGIK